VKEIVKRTLKRFDIDISRSGFRKTINDYIANRNIDLVFDVGANVGQFATSLREKGYPGQIESFEPVTSVFHTLAQTARSDHHWNVHNLALGVEPGKATINISDSSVFSSLLPTTNAATTFAETAASRRTEEIEVSTLDHFASLMAAANTLLKIDTQGFEKQVLLGARNTLSSIKGVLM
jgi:FkbM family methyltransferase